MENFYEQLIENDLNPYLLFSSLGKLKNYNKEAEFLLNFASPKELFKIASTHASQTFGFEKKFINLQYRKQNFYAILVGYINDEEIALRLYKEVTQLKSINIDKNYQLCNIFTLINLSKNTSLINSNIMIKEFYDVSIPELKIDINKFLILLNYIFSMYTDEKELTIRVFIKTGEYEIINDKKYYIVCIEFVSNKEVNISDINKENTTSTNIFYKNNKLELEIPLII